MSKIKKIIIIKQEDNKMKDEPYIRINYLILMEIWHFVFYIVGGISVLDKYGKPKIFLKFTFARKS